MTDENPEQESRELAELRELVAFLKEAGIAEFSTEREGRKLSLKFAGANAPAAAAFDPGMLASIMAHAPAATAPHAAPPAPSASAASAPAAAPVEDEESSWHIVKSPIVGTFYESPSPGTSAFVNVGDHVDNGQVLCIVEAMKLMNEIESDGEGEIVKRYVQNGQPVEYGQKLFALRQG